MNVKAVINDLRSQAVSFMYLKSVKTLSHGLVESGAIFGIHLDRPAVTRVGTESENGVFFSCHPQMLCAKDRYAACHCMGGNIAPHQTMG